MKILKFTDKRYLVVDKIEAYGIQQQESCWIVWVNIGNVSYSKDCDTEEEARTELKLVDDCFYI